MKIKTNSLVFLFFLVFSSKLFGCYLCTVTDPTVYAYTKLFSNQKDISYIEVHWKFSKLYAGASSNVYDEDKNGIIDKNELALVHKNFFEILEENKYNTEVFINGEKLDLKERIFDKNVELTYRKLESSFKIKIDREISKDLSISIDYIDPNGILAYFVKDGGFVHNILEPIEVFSNVDDFTIPLEISFDTPIKTTEEKSPENRAKEEKTLSIFFAELLYDSSHKIQQLIINIKEDSSNYSLMVLMLFSFIYGVIHAAGPGHGKSLVASYMLSHNKDLKKAFSISALIAVVHVFSAFLITFGIYFLINEFFSKYITETEMIITKISGAIIIAIGLFMIYKKIKISREIKKSRFSIHKATCGCSGCQISNKTTDLGVIIGAGIIPCPGTVTIFIFALSLKAYFIGFFAAIAMSIGMSLVIFLTATLSIGLKKINQNNKLSIILEYFSLLFIVFLGIFLTIY